MENREPANEQGYSCTHAFQMFLRECFESVGGYRALP